MANTIYSNARAKALEKYLLGIDRLNRMIDCSSADEAIKILSEVNFGEGVFIENALDFEKLIEAEQKKLISFIKQTCSQDAFKKFLLYKNDFHNAHALIIEKHLKKDAEEMLVSEGIFDISTLKDEIMVDDYSKFPKELANALRTVDGMFVNGTATGAKVDLVFKKALYSALDNLSKADKYLKTIYQTRADCVNVANALRTKNFAVVKESFITGGTIDIELLKSMIEESPEIIKDKCKYLKNGEMFIQAIDSSSKNQPLSEFEIMADSFALRLLKKERFNADGNLPYMLYCYYKLSEIDNVRIVMVGLINGLDKSDIKRRLREGYDG